MAFICTFYLRIFGAEFFKFIKQCIWLVLAILIWKPAASMIFILADWYGRSVEPIDFNFEAHLLGSFFASQKRVDDFHDRQLLVSLILSNSVQID